MRPVRAIVIGATGGFLLGWWALPYPDPINVTAWALSAAAGALVALMADATLYDLRTGGP